MVFMIIGGVVVYSLAAYGLVTVLNRYQIL